MVALRRRNDVGSSSGRRRPLWGGPGIPRPYRRIVGGMSTIAPGATVLVQQDGPAARVTLNRPEKRNALSLELMQELLAGLRRVSSEPGVRAIVLEAAGPAFSAGHDLSEMIGRDVPFFQRLFDVCTELMETIHRLPH